MVKHGPQSGFSLIEVMIALLILSVGMLGVGTLLASSLVMDRVSTGEKNAQLLCIDKVEFLRKLPRNLNPILPPETIDNPELVTQAENMERIWSRGGGLWKKPSGPSFLFPSIRITGLSGRDFSCARLFRISTEFRNKTGHIMKGKCAPRSIIRTRSTLPETFFSNLSPRIMPIWLFLGSMRKYGLPLMQP